MNDKTGEIHFSFQKKDSALYFMNFDNVHSQSMKESFHALKIAWVRFL